MNENSVTSRARTALVIGGGIGGPVAAMALRRAGIDAVIYEAHEGTADGVGGGLGIAANGQSALAAIGAGDLVSSIGSPMATMVVESWTGKRLAEFAGLPGLPVTRFVWRPDLYRALYDEAHRRGVTIEHGKRLTGAELHADGVVARFADGTTATADVLIGSDGIRSTVRGLIDPAAPGPRYSGLLGLGGWASDCGLAPTHDAMHMVFGRRAFFGYQVFDDRRVGWFANVPSRESMSIGECQALGGEEWLRRLRGLFADDRMPALDILHAVTPADLVITGALEDLPPVPVWHRGRMVITGDAAHATSPSSGQGASIAMESAVQLARCLRDLPIGEAFAAFERLRRRRVERIITMGARTNSDKAAGPVARVLRDMLMPVAMKALAKPEKLAWQYDHPIDFDAPLVTAAGIGAAV